MRARPQQRMGVSNLPKSRKARPPNEMTLAIDIANHSSHPRGVAEPMQGDNVLIDRALTLSGSVASRFINRSGSLRQIGFFRRHNVIDAKLDELLVVADTKRLDHQ